ncbi:hypothetical protein FBU30_001200, partial [Linnemannia zychae]
GITMTSNSEKKPSSGAEITPEGRQYFTRLKNYAQATREPCSKGYSIRNGLAATHIEQTKLLDPPTSGGEITTINTPKKHRLPHVFYHFSKKGDSVKNVDISHGRPRASSNPVSRLVPDKSSDSQRHDKETAASTQDVKLDQTVRPQGTKTVYRQDTAVSQGDTATTFVESSFFSEFSTTSTQEFDQTEIINFSFIPHSSFKTTEPKVLSSLARPPSYSESSELQHSQDNLSSITSIKNKIQTPELEESDHQWIRAISKDEVEKERIDCLVAEVASQFLELNYKESSSISEIVLLAPVFDRREYCSVLGSLIKQLDQEEVMNPDLMIGLVYFVESGLPGQPDDDDLVRILRVLRRKLESTFNAKDSPLDHTYLQIMVISRVLDKMVEGNVKGLRRTDDHRPLLNLLASLKDSSIPCLKYQATCAWQALQYIGDDESPLNMALRVGGGLLTAGVGIANAIKLDMEGFFSGISKLTEVAGELLSTGKTVMENVQIAQEAGEGVVDSLLKGFRNGEKRAWYPALHGARLLIREGRLAELERVIYKVPCQRENDFQLGVCQMLGEIALDPIWTTETRQQAINILEDLLRNDSEWAKDSSVRDIIRGILLFVSTNVEGTTKLQFESFSNFSNDANCDSDIKPYSLITRLPISDSTLLAKAHKRLTLEYSLHRIMTHQVEAYPQTYYIPPNAKSSPQESDENHFSLIDKVTEFLMSERKVFLILGISGSGKTSFNRYLAHTLAKDYKQGGSIPLFIYLPTIKDPENDLIPKYLRSLNFTDDNIQELKRDRQFIVVCDSYDESRLSTNLYQENGFNGYGQWNVRLIISCRTTHVGKNYRDYFEPKSLDQYDLSTSHLFQEATIIPFSEDQIQDYINRFVQDPDLHKEFEGRPMWTAAEYMERLKKIPNLLSLVTNPFLLNISLKSLPTVYSEDADPSVVNMTRQKLLKAFIKKWLDANRQRLIRVKHSEDAKKKLHELDNAGFTEIAIKFLQDLAIAIYKEQGGQAVVHYVHSSLRMTNLKPSIKKPESELTKSIPIDTTQFNVPSPVNPPGYSLSANEQFLQTRSAPIQDTQTTKFFITSNVTEPDLEMASYNLSINTLERDITEKSSNNDALKIKPEKDESNEADGDDDEFEDALESQTNDLSVSITEVLTERHKPDPIGDIDWPVLIVIAALTAVVNPGLFFVDIGTLVFGSISYAPRIWKQALRFLCNNGILPPVKASSTASKITYHEQFGVQWQERETTVSERFTYEVKTYETFETIEEVEEVVEETEDKVITTETTTTTTTTQEDVVLEHVDKEVTVDKKVEVKVDVDVDVDVEVEKKEAKETIIVKETGTVAKPAVSKGTSWFRKLATATGAAVVGAGAVAVGAGALAVGAVHDVASGAGHAASGALTKVD